MTKKEFKNILERVSRELKNAKNEIIGFEDEIKDDDLYDEFFVIKDEITGAVKQISQILTSLENGEIKEFEN